MITIREPMELDIVRQIVAGNFLFVAQRIALALHDQRRSFDCLEMLDSQLVRFAGWMERITEADQPGDFGDQAGDSPALGFAPMISMSVSSDLTKLPIVRACSSRSSNDRNRHAIGSL